MSRKVCDIPYRSYYRWKNVIRTKHGTKQASSRVQNTDESDKYSQPPEASVGNASDILDSNSDTTNSDIVNTEDTDPDSDLRPPQENSGALSGSSLAPHGSQENTPDILLSADGLSADQYSSTEKTSSAIATGGVQHLARQPPRSATLTLASIVKRHRLSDACTNDILRLVKKCRVANEPLPSTLTQLNEELGVSGLNASYNWICPICNKLSSHNLFRQPLKNIKCCQNHPVNNSTHFIILDAIQIVSEILPTIDQHLTELDEFAACQYIKSIKGPQDCNSSTISISLNTDGAAIFKSSRYSLWPILGTFNELPHPLRKKNVLLFGLWVGPNKPNFNVLFQKLIEQLRTLLNGVAWTDYYGNHRVSKVLVTHMCCDSIARSLVQGLSQFNAKYGCSYCLQESPGHYFKYQTTRSEMRTHAAHLKLVELPETVDKYGVKYKSELLQLSTIDIIQGFPIDAMHCIYLGVVKQITSCWLSSSSKCHWDKDVMSSIDTALTSIKPPSRVSRNPRSLQLHSLYKAHEWSMWLLYYSPIVLLGSIPDDVYTHWLKLVRAISILSKPFQEYDLSNAGIELTDFAQAVEERYGTNNCTYNVHLLSHLPFFAYRYGPLYNFTLYDFENFNHILGNYVTGTQYVSTQIAKRYFRDICESYFQKQPKMKVGRLTKQNEVEIGDVFLQFRANFLPNSDETYILKNFNIQTKDTEFYQKIERKNGSIVHSKAYTIVHLRNNYTVNLIDQACGFEVLVFLCHKGEVYALGTKHMLSSSGFQNLDHIFTSICSETSVVPISALGNIMLNISCKNVNYFINFLNEIENNKS